LAACDLDFVLADKFECEECYPADLEADKVAEYLSQLKSNAYPHALASNDILLTADTVVILGDKILGKPHSEEEAVEMISSLSGATHKVVTGVTLRTLSQTISFSAESLVSFRDLDAEEVSYYVEKYRPMDKAGAYGIQEWIGYIGIEGIEGSFYNVMGLPVQRLYTTLKELVK
jgi:septum formation protein